MRHSLASQFRPSPHGDGTGTRRNPPPPRRAWRRAWRRNSSCPAVRSCAPTARGRAGAKELARRPCTTARSAEGQRLLQPLLGEQHRRSQLPVDPARARRESPPPRWGRAALVGSSKMSTSGCRVSTAARFKSCFCPPESDAVSPVEPALHAEKRPPSRRRGGGWWAYRTRGLSGPKASSCQTLSVTIWFSGLCCTKPMRSACSRWRNVGERAAVEQDRAPADAVAARARS